MKTDNISPEDREYELEAEKNSKLGEDLGIKNYLICLEGGCDPDYVFLPPNRTLVLEVLSCASVIKTGPRGKTCGEVLVAIDKLYGRHLAKIRLRCHGSPEVKLVPYTDDFDGEVSQVWCCGDDHTFLETLEIKGSTVKTWFGS